MTHSKLNLGLPGFEYPDLYNANRLNALLAAFDDSVKLQQPELFAEFQRYRQSQGQGFTPEQSSELLVRMAPFLGRFIAKLFNVSAEHDRQRQRIETEMATVFEFKNSVVAKVPGVFKAADPGSLDINAVVEQLNQLIYQGFPDAEKLDPELRIASVGGFLAWLNRHFKQLAQGLPAIFEQPHEAVQSLRANLKTGMLSAFTELPDNEFVARLLLIVQQWCFLALHDTELKTQTAGWLSFKTPRKCDFEDLVEHEVIDKPGYSVWMGPQPHRRRDGFALTDPRFDQRQTLFEVDRCIYCHERDTDSCSKGMRNKKTNTFKDNPLGVTITGCPLEEKISEMHVVKRQGDNIGALAVIMIDNPMCPGTGHRICNDCMKGCIFQKTEPVNIPEIETNVLTDVLFMPYGFEIYSLLTRWNPLNIRRPHALPYNGINALVVGLGPAGYTMSHYLLNEGFGVAAIDALKLEPLPKALTGDADTPPAPLKDFADIYEALDKRTLAGFGGVAEYGITVRWDKNFLKVIYLNLVRNRNFRAYGGIRFGGSLTIEDAWELGFDHICLASGAGKPTIIDLENNLIRGIRKASDFLMALQLTGAAKSTSLANLQVRLPAGVIGGGLTAVDTATEVMAYYPVQVEKILTRYETLAHAYGEAAVRARYDREESLILDEFLAHGKAIRAERQRAAAAGEAPDFQPLLQQWGGVTLFYRKGMKDAPAYRQNHEEISKALEEGIALAEGMTPKRALEDEFGHLNAVEFEKLSLLDGRWHNAGNTVTVPLRSLYIAAGTSPNTIYQSEHPDTFVMDKWFFQRYQPEWQNGDLQLMAMADPTAPKIGKPAPLTSYRLNGKFISFYGDNHPVYAGNVVKAMASAKDGYPFIVKLFEDRLAKLDPGLQEERNQALGALFERMDNALIATIVAIHRLTPTIIEVVVKAPMQAEKFQPGQFYRIQNYEADAPVIENTVLASEALALTGAEVNKTDGTISLITLEMGSSSRLCATWKPGSQIVVMVVTGTPTEIPHNQTILLLGGGLGNAVLFSIGKALRTAGNKVIYFAAYKHAQDVFKTEEIEAAADVIIWSADKTEGVQPIPITRPQDKTFTGNILEAMLAYTTGALGEQPVTLSEAEHMIVIGSDRMMAAVKEARHGVLKPYLKAHIAIGSINSPMQCMMKGICAQCLCRHVDPETGKESFVYSCYNQDQELDRVDFKHLNGRLRQNSVQEKLSALWLDYLFGQQQIDLEIN